MRVALVCIAKDEDHYIDEWVDYYTKLGVDDIFIFQNDWRTSIERPNVEKFTMDGRNKQLEAYNMFIKHYHTLYDWVMFFDVDEFLVLKRHNNIKEFIQEYKDAHSIAINWVIFGDNGLESVESEYSVLKRVTKRCKVSNQHIKSIVKMIPGVIMEVHNPINLINTDTNRKTFIGPFNQNGPIDVAQLNHYYTKTREEFTQKIERGRADSFTKRSIKEFDENKENFNDVDDFLAFNFLYK